MKRITELAILTASYEEADKNGCLTDLGREYLKGLQSNLRMQHAASAKEDGIEITQEDFDNVIKDTTFVNRSEVTIVIERVFGDTIRSLKSRTTAEQVVVGNMATVIEGDLTREIKKLKTKKI